MLKPVLFGEKIKVQGERGSTAAGQLAEEAKARGEKAEMIPALATKSDAMVLTGEDAERYSVLMNKQKIKIFPKLLKSLPLEVISTARGKHKNDPQQLNFIFRVMMRASEDLMGSIKNELDAIFEGARVVQDVDVLGEAPEAVINDEVLFSTGTVTEVNTAQFEAIRAQSPVPVLVDFSAPWCGPCKQMEKPLDELAAKYEGKLKVVKINIDENEALAKETFGVMSVPAFVVLQNGEQVGKTIMGSMPKAKLQKELDTRLT